MTYEVAARHRPGRSWSDAIVFLDLAAKMLLVLLLIRVTLDPTWGNLEGKAPFARAVLYPMLAFVIPVVWAVRGRGDSYYPWVADLLVTAACFGDILGNRLDLYDAIVWFDDVSHFAATGQFSAAAVLLTMHHGTFGQVLERAIAIGMTCSIGWELFEYFSFVTRSSELRWAYRDTIGDLTLGWLGSFTAAAVITAYWRLTQMPSNVRLEIDARGTDDEVHPRAAT
ncbi:hypothetical protein ABT304_07590 [Nocardioides sp. NPDC000445]|uniref:hypothetical protein n=1 Tax=Nocardioides sp. NPDC000445 TaxID=3154257 RepID=UPI0033275838